MVAGENFSGFKVTYLSPGWMHTPVEDKKHPAIPKLKLDYVANTVEWLVNQPRNVNISELCLDEIMGKYEYMDDLSLNEYLWEFIRRNKEYKKAYEQYQKKKNYWLEPVYDPPKNKVYKAEKKYDKLRRVYVSLPEDIRSSVYKKVNNSYKLIKQTEKALSEGKLKKKIDKNKK